MLVLPSVHPERPSRVDDTHSEVLLVVGSDILNVRGRSHDTHSVRSLSGRERNVNRGTLVLCGLERVGRFVQLGGKDVLRHLAVWDGHPLL